MSGTHRWLVMLVLCAAGCRTARPIEVERRVPVDAIGDCVALRQAIGECREEFAPVLIDRRAQREPGLAERLRVDVEARRAAREQALQDLAREASLTAEERRGQCQVAVAELPPPRLEDVTSLHRCLPLPCGPRAACLRPLLLSKH